MKRGIRVAASIAATAFGCALLWLYTIADPMGGAWGRFFPKCPVKMLTGLDCPSCGFQRALHAALHGDFAEAWSHNLFLPVGLLYIAALIATAGLYSAGSRLRRFFWGRRGGISYILLYLVWFAVRNLLSI